MGLFEIFRGGAKATPAKIEPRRAGYTVPDGFPVSAPIYKDIATADGGALISGATGSGKSTVIEGIIYAILRDTTPDGVRLYLCDPKIVELRRFRFCRHTVRYACDYSDIIATMDAVISEMMRRYEDMSRRGLRKYDGSRIILIIDEIGDLMLSCKRDFLPRLTKLLNLCRAAAITVIIACQNPSRATLSAGVVINCTRRLALRCDSAIESRQVVGVPGAEDLPKYGRGLYKTPDKIGVDVVELPAMDGGAVQKIIDFNLKN